MKIAVIGPVYPFRGGIAHYTSYLSQVLRQQSHPTLVISFKRQFPAWLYPGKSDKDPSLEPLQTPAEFLLDPLYPWTWWRTARRIAQFTPDLLVIQWWTTFWALPYFSISNYLRNRGITLIYLIHNVLPHETRPWDQWLATQVLQRGDFFIAQSQQEKDRLLNLIPDAQVSICQIPVYKKFLGKHVSKMEARKLLSLPDSVPVILFFGIIRPYKGLRILIQSLAQLKAQGKELILLVAGEFWEKKQVYLELIERYQLSEQVRLEDRYIPNEEVDVIFSASDLMVLPYLDGTQSAVAGLALGYGLPLIITDKISSGISTENMQSVQVVPAGDVVSLTSSINKTLDQLLVSETARQPAADNWMKIVNTLEVISRRSSSQSPKLDETPKID